MRIGLAFLHCHSLASIERSSRHAEKTKINVTWPLDAGHVSLNACGPDGTMNAGGRADNQQPPEKGGRLEENGGARGTSVTSIYGLAT